MSLKEMIPFMSSNRAYPWDENFDSYKYQKENFGKMLDFDVEILERIALFYKQTNPQGRFLEVGAGSNLYPILLALPYADELEVWEYSKNNVAYLEEQLKNMDLSWKPWIDLMREHNPGKYDGVNFQQQLKDKVSIIQGSIFDLPKGKWNNISMHSVAESITGRRREFNNAVKSFKDAAQPNATMAASFVANSKGYNAGGVFPAVPIETMNVLHIIGPRMNSLDFAHTQAELRPGSPLIVMTGRFK